MKIHLSPKKNEFPAPLCGRAHKDFASSTKLSEVNCLHCLKAKKVNDGPSPYSEDERKQAWRDLYDTFNCLPVPKEQVWRVQAELNRVKSALVDALDALKASPVTEPSRDKVAEEGR